MRAVFSTAPLLLVTMNAVHRPKNVFSARQDRSLKKSFVVFTSKNNLIWVISAGDMSRKEREVYSNEEADTGFQNEAEEREFRAVHDSTEYIDWNRSEQVTFFNLKPSVRKISLRLPESMLEEPNCRPTKGMSRISC
jgi:predicted DNA binding CopG/RHH family protein